MTYEEYHGQRDGRELKKLRGPDGTGNPAQAAKRVTEKTSGLLIQIGWPDRTFSLSPAWQPNGLKRGYPATGGVNDNILTTNALLRLLGPMDDL
jgi:hypothetical protein